MINAWALAYEVLEGTLDETYPIIKNDKGGRPHKTEEGCEDDSDCQH